MPTVPGVGERAYASLASPPATADTPPAAGTLSLQVLKGTVSFGLSRQAPALASGHELTAALGPLVQLAQKLVRELGPDRPGASAPAAPPGTPAETCTYDDAGYLAGLGGAATVVAEIPRATQAADQISLRLISLPTSPPEAPAFDRRAADLGGCTAIQERVPGGGSRARSPLGHPTVDTSGQAGYAVVYMLPDGTGVRHILVGARKGRLCVEAETETLSDGAVQQAADGLAATINKVMAKVGG